MAKNTDRNDDFWTLSEFVPKRTYIKKPESDISPVTVETGDEEGAGTPDPTVGKIIVCHRIIYHQAVTVIISAALRFRKKVCKAVLTFNFCR